MSPEPVPLRPRPDHTPPVAERICGTCQHWLTIDPGEYGGPSEPPNMYGEGGEPLNYGEAGRRVKAPGEWGYCGKVDFLGPQAGRRFYVRDGSEYMAKLGTREDFGCVEHEPNGGLASVHKVLAALRGTPPKAKP